MTVIMPAVILIFIHLICNLSLRETISLTLKLLSDLRKSNDVQMQDFPNTEVSFGYLDHEKSLLVSTYNAENLRKLRQYSRSDV